MPKSRISILKEKIEKGEIIFPYMPEPDCSIVNRKTLNCYASHAAISARPITSKNRMQKPVQVSYHFHVPGSIKYFRIKNDICHQVRKNTTICRDDNLIIDIAKPAREINATIEERLMKLR